MNDDDVLMDYAEAAAFLDVEIPRLRSWQSTGLLDAAKRMAPKALRASWAYDRNALIVASVVRNTLDSLDSTAVAKYVADTLLEGIPDGPERRLAFPLRGLNAAPQEKAVWVGPDAQWHEIFDGLDVVIIDVGAVVDEVDVKLRKWRQRR